MILRKINSRGLTLLEALCTLALLAMVMAALFGVLRLASGGSARSREVLRRARVVSGIGRIMGRDFFTAWNHGDANMPALHGGRVPLSSDGVRLVFFCTHTLATEPKYSPSGVRRVEYLLKESETTDGRYDLFRRETPYTADKPLDRSLSQTERLATGLATWRMRFSDAEEWHDEWRRDYLPQEARLEWVFASDDAAANEVEVFYFSPQVSVEVDAFPVTGAAGK